MGRADRGRAAPTSIDEHRLAYVAEAPVNWCPGLGTVLANEEVTADGRSERGNFPVFKRNLRQWMMRITAYADRLIDDLDLLDWPESIKLMQRNWIGRCDGRARSTSPSPAGADRGVHHPARHAVRRDVHGAGARAPAGRRADRRPPGPTGTDRRWTGGARHPGRGGRRVPRAGRGARPTSSARPRPGTRPASSPARYATNPVNGEQIPVFIADYVLMGYGTGAIMAVPGQDERDWEFAERLRPADRPHRRSRPTGWDGEAFIGEGPAINSANDEARLDGLGVAERQGARSSTGWRRTGTARARSPTSCATGCSAGSATGASRSRSSTTRTACPIALPESMLPVELPEVDDFSPRTFDPDDDALRARRRPLDRATRTGSRSTLDLGDGPKQLPPRDQHDAAVGRLVLVRAALPGPDQRRARSSTRRSSGTGWARSRRATAGGVDLYVGGVEHAVLHLLYARFWHKVLFDLGHVSSREPFHRLFNQGNIQAARTRTSAASTSPAAEVDERDGGFFYEGEPVTREYGQDGQEPEERRSPPTRCTTQYGADTLRLYEMAMGPLDASRPWETRGVVGMYRFLQRLWRNVVDEETGEVTRRRRRAPTTRRCALLHRTIDGVRDRHGGAALQHRDRQADRAEQPPDQGRAARCRARSPSRWC